MPKGWKTQAWNCLFIGLGSLPAEKWNAVIGSAWVPFVLVVCAVGNSFSAWVKDQNSKAGAL